MALWHMVLWHMALWHMVLWHMALWHMALWHMVLCLSPPQVRARAECAGMTLAYGMIPHTEEDCSSYFGQPSPRPRLRGSSH